MKMKKAQNQRVNINNYEELICEESKANDLVIAQFKIKRDSNAKLSLREQIAYSLNLKKNEEILC